MKVVPGLPLCAAFSQMKEQQNASFRLCFVFIFQVRSTSCSLGGHKGASYLADKGQTLFEFSTFAEYFFDWAKCFAARQKQYWHHISSLILAHKENKYCNARKKGQNLTAAVVPIAPVGAVTGTLTGSQSGFRTCCTLEGNSTLQLPSIIASIMNLETGEIALILLQRNFREPCILGACRFVDSFFFIDAWHWCYLCMIQDSLGCGVSAPWRTPACDHHHSSI